MKVYEAMEYLGSLAYRSRDLSEMGRFIAYIIAQTNSKKTLKPSDIMKFPWDKEEGPKAPSNEELKRLKEKAKRIAEKKKNG